MKDAQILVKSAQLNVKFISNALITIMQNAFSFRLMTLQQDNIRIYLILALRYEAWYLIYLRDDYLEVACNYYYLAYLEADRLKRI